MVNLHTRTQFNRLFLNAKEKANNKKGSFCKYKYKYCFIKTPYQLGYLFKVTFRSLSRCLKATRQLTLMQIKCYLPVLNYRVWVQLPTTSTELWRGSEEGYKQKRRGEEKKDKCCEESRCSWKSFVFNSFLKPAPARFSGSFPCWGTSCSEHLFWTRCENNLAVPLQAASPDSAPVRKAEQRLFWWGGEYPAR